MCYSSNHPAVLVSNHLGKEIQQADNATELTLETQIRVIRIQFVGKQKKFAGGVSGRRHLPDGDLDVACAIVKFLLVQTIEHIKIILVLECRVDHSQQPGHYRQHAVTLIVRAESIERRRPLSPPLQFGEIEATGEQSIKCRRCIGLTGFLPFLRVALVEFHGNMAHSGHHFGSVCVDHPVDIGLGQIARVKTVFFPPVGIKTRRTRRDQNSHWDNKQCDEAFDHPQ